MNKHPLQVLYGDNAISLATTEIMELSKNSNIPFDKEYVNLGMSFLVTKAKKVIAGEEKKKSLKSLVIDSFGEAAIYKYNFNGGVL